MKVKEEDVFAPSFISRQRKRSENKAVAFYKERTSKSVEAQVPFIKQIRGVARPYLEARKIVAEELGEKDAKENAKVWVEQVNPVTWKLTDGVMTEQEGRFDLPTTRGLVWISGYGWKKDRTVHLESGRSERRNATVPTHFKVYRRNKFGVESVVRDTLQEAKEAARDLYFDRPCDSHSSVYP